MAETTTVCAEHSGYAEPEMTTSGSMLNVYITEGTARATVTMTTI